MREWWYWNVRRKTTGFIPWVSRKLVPKKVKYWVIVSVAVRSTNEHPAEVPAIDMLEYLYPTPTKPISTTTISPKSE